METISLKVDESMLDNVDKVFKKNNFSTRTEFIRDAIRSKLDKIRRDRLIEEFLKFKGKAKKRTTRSENRKTAEEALLKIAKQRGWEI